METYYDKIQDLIKKGYIFQLGTLPDVMTKLENFAFMISINDKLPQETFLEWGDYKM